MIHPIRNFLKRCKAKQVRRACSLLEKANYRVDVRGKTITLDEAIEVMIHQITAGRPDPNAYRLIFESMAMSIHLAGVGTSVYETIAIKDSIVEVLEDKIRHMQCTTRSLQLAKEAAQSLIETCRSLHDPRLITPLANYDKRK